jgi:hypothetical protein
MSDLRTLRSGAAMGRTSAQQDAYGPHPKTNDPHTVAPHLETIRAIQNQPLVPKGLGAWAPWHQACTRPETLRPQALYTLGFTNSAARSEQIVQGLKKLTLFDDKGALQYRVRGLDRQMIHLQSLLLGGQTGLTFKEEVGVRIYLLGLEENLQLLGQDMAKLPVKQRRDWLFYIDHQDSLQNSRIVSDRLKSAGVLGKNYLPKNGGKKFDKLLAKQLEGHSDRTRREIQNWFSAVRESLFPLPPYSERK